MSSLQHSYFDLRGTELQPVIFLTWIWVMLSRQIRQLKPALLAARASLQVAAPLLPTTAAAAMATIMATTSATQPQTPLKGVIFDLDGTLRSEKCIEVALKLQSRSRACSLIQLICTPLTASCRVSLIAAKSHTCSLAVFYLDNVGLLLASTALLSLAAGYLIFALRPSSHFPLFTLPLKHRMTFYLLLVLSDEIFATFWPTLTLLPHPLSPALLPFSY